MKKIIIIGNDTTYLYNLRKELIAELVSNDYEVSFWGTIKLFQQELETLGCKVHDIELNRHGKNPFSDLLLSIKYFQIFRREKPFCILSYNIKPNIYGGIASSLLGIRFFPNITGIGGALFHEGLMQRISVLLYKIGLKNASCIFFQNQGNYSFMLEHGCISHKHKICVLPGSGVSLEGNPFETYPCEECPIVLLYIARMMKDKGVDEMLCAAKYIHTVYPNIIFEFVGSCDEAYDELLVEYQDKGIIRYLGHRNDIHNLIKNSNCVILPSYHEGMANTLLEAAACGRPVIATDVSGCKETFDSGTGISCKVADSDDLIRAIIDFISLPYSQKVLMGKKARAKMEMEFDRNIVIRKYIEYINQK